MKEKKELFTLISAILAGVGAFIFLILSPISFDMSSGMDGSGMSYSRVEQSFDMSGFDAIFGYSLLGVLSVNEFNFILFLTIAIVITACVMLFLDRFGKIKTDLTLYYVIGLGASTVLVFLSSTIISLSDMLELAMKSGDMNGVTMGFSLTFWGILSGLCLAGSTALLVIKQWVLKEKTQEIE